MSRNRLTVVLSLARHDDGLRRCAGRGERKIVVLHAILRDIECFADRDRSSGVRAELRQIEARERFDTRSGSRYPEEHGHRTGRRRAASTDQPENRSATEPRPSVAGSGRTGVTP